MRHRSKCRSARIWTLREGTIRNHTSIWAALRRKGYRGRREGETWLEAIGETDRPGAILRGVRTWSLYVTQAVVLGLVSATAVYNLEALQYRFGGYDLSPLIDVGWRVLSGQAPNRDFVCTFPPLLYLIAAGAFRMWGVEWHSLALAGSLCAVLLTLLGLRVCALLRAPVGQSSAALASVVFGAAQMLPLLVVGHPWHSALSASVAAYTLLASYAVVRNRKAGAGVRWECLAHAGVGMALLLISKPNSAWPAMLVCLAALALARVPVWTLTSMVAAGAAVDCLLLRAVHTDLLAMAWTDVRLTGRFVPSRIALGIFEDPSVAGGLATFVVFLLIAPLLGPMARLAWAERRRLFRDPALVLATGGCAVALLGFCTDVEVKIVDTPPLLIGSLLLALESGEGLIPHRRSLLRSAAGLTVVAIFLSATRARMQFVGPWAEDSCGARVELRDAFFGEFYGCAPFGGVLAETDAALAMHPEAKVFFGSRMEFLYARDRIRSPEQLPLWWDPGTSYPLAMEAEVASAWRDHGFDLLMFPRSERVGIPARILNDMDRDYVISPGTKYVDVYLRRR